jgi:antitoxin Phd
MHDDRADATALRWHKMANMAKMFQIVPEVRIMSTLTFRNSQGELIDILTVAASRFKNEFAAILEKAALGGAVAITKHDSPKAVLLSYAEFESLVKSRSPALDDLSAQFDGLLARMQTPKARKGMATAFNASPVELGRAATKAAAKKR